MAAELHLAELTLHLFLQHPERLVDIVVPYENLHAVFLSRVGVAWTIGYGRDLGQRRRDAEAPGMLWLTPADAHHAALPAPIKKLLRSLVTLSSA